MAYIFYLYSIPLETQQFHRYFYSLNGVQRTVVDIGNFSSFSACIAFALITNVHLGFFFQCVYNFTMIGSFQQLSGSSFLYAQECSCGFVKIN